MPRFVRFCCLAEKFAACQTHHTILCGKKVRPCLSIPLPLIPCRGGRGSRPVPVTEEMVAAMNGARPKAAYMGRDLLCVFDDADTVRNMTVDQDKVRALDGLLLHVTAPGTDVDCGSRSFAPKCNVAEDPVCGSGHCHIVPYWVQTLGKDTLVAYQASRRGGTLYCTQAGDRIRMSGNAAVYSVADIRID